MTKNSQKPAVYELMPPQKHSLTGTPLKTSPTLQHSCPPTPNGPTDRAISTTPEDRREPEPALAEVTIREIWPPAISAGADDDVFDIDPRWRQ